MTLYAVVRKGTDEVMVVSNRLMIYLDNVTATYYAKDIKSYDTSPDFQVEVREGEFKIK